MRRLSLALVTAFIAGVAAIAVHSDEPRKPAAPSVSEGVVKKAKPEPPAADDEPEEDAVKEIVSGKVVALRDALTRRGIKSYAEELKGQVVLVTRGGELIPIVPDWRGRALYQDERLRDRPVDLVVNRRKGVPWVQVLSIYTFDDKGVRNITDYWCDVCSIPMYEIKDCECCQGPTRLRFRPQELPKDLSRREPPDEEKSQPDKTE